MDKVSLRRLARVLVPLIGISVTLGEMVTLFLGYPMTHQELMDELTTGTGQGILFLIAPYIIYWFVTRNMVSKLHVVGGGLALLLLGVGSFLVASFIHDAQGAFIFFYALLAQGAVLVFILVESQKSQASR